MAGAREVKKRIKSVKNIAQITRALEAVSASRVRRAQERAFASRAYSEKAWEILLNVQNAIKGATPHPLLSEREEIKSTLVVLVTSDRGLAGAFNTNIIRVALNYEQRLGKPVKFVTVGRKGRDTMIRLGKKVIAEFSDLPANPSIADISPISQLAVESFLSGEVDEVLIAYTDFINMLTQRPVVLGWLPLTPHNSAEQVASEYVKAVPQVTAGSLVYEYEPDASAVIDEIVPRFTELQLFQTILESQASEHAARMSAMHNATDNASSLVGDLTLEYNKARQAAITNEILDIVGGASALEETLAAKAKSQMEALMKLAAASHIEKNGASQIMKAAAASAPAQGKPAAASAKKVKANTEDDLTKIEGIGKKMQQALYAAGIKTYAQLATKSEDDLRAAIEAAGMRFSPSLSTWAEQAGFAAKGNWDGLKALQDSLVGGRRVDSED